MPWVVLGGTISSAMGGPRGTISSAMGGPRGGPSAVPCVVLGGTISSAMGGPRGDHQQYTVRNVILDLKIFSSNFTILLIFVA